VTKVVFWHAYSTDSGEYKVLTEKVIPEFNRLHPDIKVVQQQVPYDTMYQKLIVGVRSGVLSSPKFSANPVRCFTI
ncbi:MAG: extracellular solute-binding protein, partial [Candidatus Aerophobetes bacterium]|nr:extracellular solute-binding protein [Candidatus Aerophobetes bacterium]